MALLLEVRAIAAVYNHVVLALRDVSLEVPEGSIVALLGGNGAGKTTTLRAISCLLTAERGKVTHGGVWLRGERTDGLRASALVRRGLVQVMEGRHCFGHLTIEENLLTGSWTRTDGAAAVAGTLQKVYDWFPRLKTRRDSRAATTSGGEQQMCAIGRALMADPRLVLLDEPSMGLAPQLVAEVFGIVRELNRHEGVSFLIAEQNSHMALEHAHTAYVLESGQVVLHGTAAQLAGNEVVQATYLGAVNGTRVSFREPSETMPNAVDLSLLR